MTRLSLVPAANDAAPVKVRALDLFSGLGGWARPLLDRGHDVVTLDNDARFGCDFTRDILNVRSLSELEGDGGRFGLVVASPPCQAFTLLTTWRNWRKDGERYIAQNQRTRDGVRIMRHTFALIEEYGPRFFVVENPRGMMRMIAPRKPDLTVWYCKCGEKRAKPTDLWTNLPVRWPMACRYRNPECDHERVPRGVRGGTIGLKTPALRSLIPYGLALTVTMGVEQALGATALMGADKNQEKPRAQRAA